MVSPSIRNDALTDSRVAAPARTHLLLTLLLFLAFLLRAYGFWWGRPYALHNDESFVITHTLKMLAHVRAGALPDPETMIYGVWPFYQLGLVGTAVRGVIGFLGALVGYGGNLSFLYIGRLLSALYGALGVLALYVLGARMFSQRTGLWAAAFWAVMPLSVRDSHFATVDVQFAVWLVLTYVALWNVAERGRARDYILAAVMMGLTLATRLSALPIFAAFLVALWIRTGDDRASSIVHRLSSILRTPALYLVPLASLTLWAILSVPVLDDLPAHLAGDTNSDLNVQSMVARGTLRPLYTVQFELTRPYLYHLTHLFPWAMTWPLALLAYAGWLYSLWRMARGDQRDWLLAAWTLPYFLTVGGWYVKFFRYIIPLLPFLALYAARLVADTQNYTSRLPHHASRITYHASRITHYASYLLTLLATLAFLAPLLFSLAYLHIYARPDTRLQALAWIKEHIPPGTTVMMEFDASTKFAIHPERFGLDVYDLRVLNHYEVKGRVGRFWQAPDVSPDEKWAYMMEVVDDAAYIVITEAWADVFPRLPHRFPAEAKFYTQLFNGDLGYTLVAQFQECPQLGPWRLCDEGAEMSWRYFDHPRVYVFKRNDDGR